MLSLRILLISDNQLTKVTHTSDYSSIVIHCVTLFNLFELHFTCQFRSENAGFLVKVKWNSLNKMLDNARYSRNFLLSKFLLPTHLFHFTHKKLPQFLQCKFNIFTCNELYCIRIKITAKICTLAFSYINIFLDIAGSLSFLIDSKIITGGVLQKYYKKCFNIYLVNKSRLTESNPTHFFHHNHVFVYFLN